MILRKGKRPLYGLTPEERTLIKSYGFTVEGENQYTYEYAIEPPSTSYPFNHLAGSEFLAIVAVLGESFFPALATVVALGNYGASRSFWKTRNDHHNKIFKAHSKLREVAKP